MMMAGGLIIAAGTTIIINQLQSVQRKSDRIIETNSNMELIRQSLVNFAKVTKRLPCPTTGALDTGLSAPAAPSQNCTNPNGTVPWVTLGLSKSASLDGWGRKISYRVFQGATGLTQTNGADMTNCYKIVPPLPPVSAAPPDFMCSAGHTTSKDDYLANRPGFTVVDNGIPIPIPDNKFAFVLISHGGSGNGAWITGGGRVTLPPAGNVQEFGNTQAGLTYYNQTYSDPTVMPTAINHFDDVVVYMSIPELLSQAARSARDWL